MTTYRLTGDVCHPGVVEFKGTEDELRDLLGEEMACIADYDEDTLKIYDVDRSEKVSGFIHDGSIQDEDGNEVELPAGGEYQAPPPQITKGGDPDGNDYEVPEALGKEGFWLTVGKASILIKDGDDGVSAAIYPLHGEADDSLAEAWVTHGELEPEEG